MTSSESFEKSRNQLEVILNREINETLDAKEKDIQRRHDPTVATKSEQTDQEMEDSMKKYGLMCYLRTDQPHIIGLGTHQATIELGDGLVSKVFRKASSKKHNIPNVVDIGRGMFQYMQETIEMFKELGFSIDDAVFYKLMWQDQRIVVSPDVIHNSISEDYHTNYVYNPSDTSIFDPKNYPNAYITRDLREGGKYMVVEYNAKIAKTLCNGAELIEQFREGCNRLIELSISHEAGGDEEYVQDDKIWFMHEPHRILDRKEAIKKLFLLQVPTNKKDKGKLVIGDYDHVYLYR